MYFFFFFFIFWPPPQSRESPASRPTHTPGLSARTSHTSTRSRLICSGWPAEASLQCEVLKVLDPAPEGPPQMVSRDDTQTSAQLGKPNSGGNNRTNIPAGHSGCPLWTLVVLIPAAAGASSNQDAGRAWVEGVPDVSTHNQQLPS